MRTPPGQLTPTKSDLTYDETDKAVSSVFPRPHFTVVAEEQLYSVNHSHHPADVVH